MSDRPPGRSSSVPRLVGSFLLAALATGLAAGMVAGRGGPPDDFPHDEHVGLFPVCTGCHAGVETGDESTLHPAPERCVSCHDGEREDEVDWTGPSIAPDNLRFDHREHAREMEGEYGALECTDCHAAPDSTRAAAGRETAVAIRAGPTGCLSCHAHEAADHLADAECSTCHLPLAETRFTRSRIADLPLPSSHEDPAFLASLHGPATDPGVQSCATCHTRDSCASCHVDAARVDRITTLPLAPPGMRLPAWEASYPVPETHTRPDFLEAHGEGIQAGECSTCHTRESCTSCHRGAPTGAITELVSREEASAPGAPAVRRAPESHETALFGEQHGTLASTDETSCTTCHMERSCTECHQEAASGPALGPDAFEELESRERDERGGRFDLGSGGGFHPPNYAMQHATEAFGQTLECSNCHDTARFCRDCHQQLGFGSEGRLGPGFHDAEPLWVFRHGQAARQTLESCASCHRQRDCIQCHSELGRFQVSPHGDDFDAERLFDRNPQICFACHISNPLEGGTP